MDYLERYYSAIEADRKALDARPAATTGAQPRPQSAPAQNEAADEAGDADEDDDASGWNIFGNLFKRKRKPPRRMISRMMLNKPFGIA